MICVTRAGGAKHPGIFSVLLALTLSIGVAGCSGRLSVGEYGILGVGLARSREKLGNPLLALPPAYARSWSIELSESGGSLIMRPRMTTQPIARFPLKPDGRDASGARAW